MQLNELVDRYMPLNLSQSRDYTGNKGWKWIYNEAVYHLQLKGLLRKFARQERAAVVENGVWIDPAQFGTYKKLNGIYLPDRDSNNLPYKGEYFQSYSWEWVNEKIRINVTFDDAEYTSQINGTDIVLNDPATTHVEIDNTAGDDVTSYIDDDQFAGYLLVTDTAGERILISGNEDGTDDATHERLLFLHTQNSAPSGSNPKLTDEYVICEIDVPFAKLTSSDAETVELPIDDEFELPVVELMKLKAIELSDGMNRQWLAQQKVVASAIMDLRATMMDYGENAHPPDNVMPALIPGEDNLIYGSEYYSGSQHVYDDET